MEKIKISRKRFNSLFKKYEKYKVFGVAFVSKAEYTIYEFNKSNIKKMDRVLNLKTFNLDYKENKFKQKDMEGKIHKVHNYIRDYTKISDSDKGFFIAIILISLKKKSFRIIIEKYDEKKYIYDLMEENLREHGIDINIFSFFKSDQNNKHFLNIINIIMEIYENSMNVDLLNLFYHEFVKYNNNDSSSLGIVLTPEHIVKLMVEMLEINENDIILDLCTGTGSFLLECMNKNPLKIIGCEYQSKLYALLKCNMILRNIDNYKIINDDCFNHKFKATKSIINPPYGMKDKTELHFVEKQLDSIEDGGLVVAIIPCSKLNSGNNNLLKKNITKQAKIKSIIICNPRLFQPHALVKCCIVLFEKNKIGHLQSDKVNYIDYSDDRKYIEKHCGWAKETDFEEKYNAILSCKNFINIDVEKDWCFQNDINHSIDKCILDLTEIKISQVVKKTEIKIEKIRNDNNIVSFDSYKTFKISDLFEMKKGNCIIKKSKSGKYPLISASKLNKGVSKYIDTCNFKKESITVASNGSVGSSFYQEIDFNATSDVIILIPRVKLSKNVCIFICKLLEQYKSKYNYERKWTLNRMKEDTLNIPWKFDKIDYEIMENFVIKNIIDNN